ncbi:anhydro-N-acetylmuramic acid kinase [Blastopirellula sp. JC732]|uniref:Anhydro-N-acetylmuramic acid kinase n=1 Tax=Blastopirellula sediminis TaxID=2894196 RepID=A0A9X1SEY6_9BACT|nr:anhydro-N-acetylmuramic acid kinase [Blastopirellula sediminis]MCC9608818.1 anhydro-N-acetylmuramic acid kinase [Blastopirellula sediminis]MCC9628405.1 anhydro-N-acetylmuramic acid kinase [Blastopirellula sediminis]
MRSDAAISLERRRWFLGAAVGLRAETVDGVVIATRGRGLEATVEVVSEGYVELPKPIAITLRQHLHGEPISPSERVELSRQIAELQTVVVERLLHEVDLDARQVAVGLSGPTAWRPLGEAWAPETIGAPELVAEATGATVIDAFAERNIAAGGTGGPLDALPLWLLFSPPQWSSAGRPTIAVTFDETVDAYFIPPRRVGVEIPAIYWSPVAPGRLLQDQLEQIQPAAAGKSKFEAVLSAWREIESLYQTPIWRPDLFDLAPFAAAADGRVDESQGEALLRRFWQEQVAHAIQADLPTSAAAQRIVLLGEPLGVDEIADKIRDRTELTVETALDLGWSPRIHGPAVAALLAFSFLERFPADVTMLTGSKAARVLGRITPGSPANWQYCLEQLATAPSGKMPLRNAV